MRALIVGCGCRGQALARALAGRGLAVRGTTRDPERAAAIEAAGAEAVVADPLRLDTLMPALDGVSLVYWLMGTADPPEVNADRLDHLLARLVDTPVRGFVYEAAGGAPLVRAAGRTWNIPVAVVEAGPADHEAWLAAMTAAARELTGA